MKCSNAAEAAADRSAKQIRPAERSALPETSGIDSANENSKSGPAEVAQLPDNTFVMEAESYKDDSALTATTISGIPATLDRSRMEWHRRQFEDEYDPIGPTELALVIDLARQAAAMERWGDAAMAIEREGARALPELMMLSDSADQLRGFDSMLSAAMSTDAADRSERHSMARTRAFHRTLNKLEEVQDRRKQRARLGQAVMPPPFVEEAACEAYLEIRLRSDLHRCGKCGSASGCFLPSRRSWECRTCRMQAGLRWGTVMAGSALPLITWFGAIRLLLWRPTIGTAELAEHMGVRRVTTVRNVARRIREAMAADDASARLAGLDQYFERAAFDLNQASETN